MASSSRAASEATEQLRNSRFEADGLSSELVRLRDQLSRVEAARLAADREAASHRLDSNQLRAQLDDAEMELEQLREQVNEERETGRGMHNLLHVAKEKEQQAAQEAQVGPAFLLFPPRHKRFHFYITSHRDQIISDLQLSRPRTLAVIYGPMDESFILTIA
ncbi:unnamed protein product [Protopolystoma xenopodis]|uniref:Uncharacterized protein n=1 Tax=Protopolystoma xenopodis TaxID=117903 RepID=A0A448WU42_9PLAT|nr:unnamed protein product [Protopolystoma xenopodis]